MRILLVGYLCLVAAILRATGLPVNSCGFPIVSAGAVLQSNLLMLPPHSHRYLTYFAMEFPKQARGFAAADYMASHITLKGVLEDQFGITFKQAMAGGEIYLVNVSEQTALGKIQIINNTSSLMFEAQSWERERNHSAKHPNDPQLFLAALRESGLGELISDSVVVTTSGMHIIPPTPPHIRHRVVKHRQWLERAEREAAEPELLQWFTDLIWIDWYVRTEGKQVGTPQLAAASAGYLNGIPLRRENRAELNADLDTLLTQVNAASSYLEIFLLAGTQ